MVRVIKIRKRTGEIVPFQPVKITAAIEKAMKAVDFENRKVASDITEQIVGLINARITKFKDNIPDVEQVQDTVEEVLMKSPFDRVAKAYILYRKARGHAREIKKFFGIKDDLKLGVNAIKVLEERYLLRNEQGNIAETPTELFRRVARTVAAADLKYKNALQVRKIEEEFFNMMKNLEFLPNSPTLMNAGTPLGQLAACFVLPIEDSLDSIFTTLKNMATIQQSGGGTGFSFSKLRPKGDMVKSTRGVASGPVSFLNIYDSTTEVIKQGGKRRGANMGILHCQHPDIEEFVVAKRGSGKLSNFNISVAITDEFMKAVSAGKPFKLVNPRNNEIAKKISAKDLFSEIVKSAWMTGDPGLIFIDEINSMHPLQLPEKIEATNPCGEQPLLAYESCNLGSINLARMLKTNKQTRKKEIDWEKISSVAKTAIHFLDNVIDVNKFPLPEIEQLTKANRKIGLGVMGFADMMIQLEIPYDSKEALKMAEKIMSFIAKVAREKSAELGKEKGSFLNFDKSIWKKKFSAMRNSTVTTIAPTGTIGIIAGCSSGIEPIFAVAFVREVMEKKHLIEVNPFFQLEIVKKGLWEEELIKKIAQTGTIEKIKLPEELKKIFITALEISPEWHVKMQSVFQKYVDNAVSKTINLPEKSSANDVKKAYLLAYRLKCKGITVYRYGSKPEQVLYLGKGGKLTTAELHYSGGCIGSVCSF